MDSASTTAARVFGSPATVGSPALGEHWTDPENFYLRILPAACAAGNKFFRGLSRRRPDHEKNRWARFIR